MRVLESLQFHADPETGLVDVDRRERLYERAAMSRASWRRGIEDLGDLVVVHEPTAYGHPERYQIDPEGVARYRARSGHVARLGSGHGPTLLRTLPKPLPSSSLENQEKEEEGREAPIAEDRARSGQIGPPGPGQIAVHPSLLLPLPRPEDDPKGFARRLRAIADVYDPPAATQESPRPTRRPQSGRMPAKDRNGWEAKDVQVACCGSTMSARRNRKDDEWFGFCTTCQSKYDPASDGRDRGKKADQDQERRVAARPASAPQKVDPSAVIQSIRMRHDDVGKIRGESRTA